MLVVEPQARRPAKVRQAAALAEGELSQIPDVTRTDTAGLSEDKRAELVVGYLHSDVEDIAVVGEDVKELFVGDPDVTAGGAAVTAHELNETTEEDLRRIELVGASHTDG